MYSAINCTGFSKHMKRPRTAALPPCFYQITWMCHHIKVRPSSNVGARVCAWGVFPNDFPIKKVRWEGKYFDRIGRPANLNGFDNEDPSDRIFSFRRTIPIGEYFAKKRPYVRSPGHEKKIMVNVHSRVIEKLSLRVQDIAYWRKT